MLLFDQLEATDDDDVEEDAEGEKGDGLHRFALPVPPHVVVLGNRVDGVDDKEFGDANHQDAADVENVFAVLDVWTADSKVSNDI